MEDDDKVVTLSLEEESTCTVIAKALSVQVKVKGWGSNILQVNESIHICVSTAGLGQAL